MAYQKKTWTDRTSQYPNRRTLTDVATGTTQTVEIARAEGTVGQVGDAFSAANMNDLESRIEAAIGAGGTGEVTIFGHDQQQSTIDTPNLTITADFDFDKDSNQYVLFRRGNMADVSWLISGDITLNVNNTGDFVVKQKGTTLTTSTWDFPKNIVYLAQIAAYFSVTTQQTVYYWSLFEIPAEAGLSGIVQIANGGTGNADGYIRTGAVSGETIGQRTTIEGYQNHGSGQDSHVEGYDCTASAANTHAEGWTTVASGSYAHSEGRQTLASNTACHAEGKESEATNIAAHAEGYGTHATGQYTHAEGVFSTASGNWSHAQNYSTSAGGLSAHAEGYGTSASGNYSHAQGYATVAGYQSQTVMGEYNDNKSTTLLEIGNGTGTNAKSNALEVYANGNVVAGGTITDGNGNTIPTLPLSTSNGGTGNTAGYIQTGAAANSTIGANATIEGTGNTSSGSGAHAEGYAVLASGTNAHAEGRETTASGTESHAEGYANISSGANSHTEGKNNTASGLQAHAEGDFNGATGNYSHAGGRYNTAGYSYQTVIGKYNSNKSDTLFEVGNGTGTSAANRSNAFEVYSNGNIVASGTISDVNGALTAVAANPSDTASTNLTKLKVGSTTYSIPSGSTAKQMRKDRYTISYSSWSSSKDSNGYYYLTRSLSYALDTSYAPNIYIAGNGDSTFPTTTQKNMFSFLREALLTDSTTLKLYVTTKPTSTFYIWVEGLEA